MRLDGAKKSQGACQDLISWEDSGPAVLDLGLLLLASYSELAEDAGLLARRVPSEKGPRRGTTKRLGPSRAISLCLRFCTRGNRTARDEHASRAEHGRGVAETR